MGPAQKARGVSVGLSRKGSRTDARSLGVGPPRWILWGSKAPRFFHAPPPFARTAPGEPLVDRQVEWVTKIFGPARRTDSRQAGVQVVHESASCVAARNAGSVPSTGVTGALEASAGVRKRRKTMIGPRCRIAHSRHGSRRSRQANGAKASARVRSSRSRCARVPRRLQKSTGDAWFKKRLSVAAGNADGT